MHELRAFKSQPEIKLFASVQRSDDLIVAEFVLNDEKKVVQTDKLQSSAQRRQELWKETCFEIFWSPAQSQEYWELNLATSGDWNIYQFKGYRSPGYPNLVEERRIREIKTQMKPDLIKVEIPIKDLNLSKSDLEFSMNAVLKLKSGETSYWALTHLKDKPDFHVRESFILKK